KAYLSLAKLGYHQLGHLLHPIPPTTLSTPPLITSSQTLLTSLPQADLTTMTSVWSTDWQPENMALVDLGVGLHGRFLSMKNYSTKAGYLSGIDTTVLTIESWNRYFQKQIHWRQVWLRIGSNKILKMKGRDLWYNIATNRLVLRSRLRKWQPESPSSCFACRSEEHTSE